MNNIISILSGIDQPIQKLQSNLYAYLLNKWNLTSDTYSAYGRSYRNKVTDGYRPEAFIGGDYKALVYDDTVSAMSFFALVDPENSVQGYSNETVGIIFCMNLSKCKPNNNSQMLDEQAINDVTDFINRSGNGFTLKKKYRYVDHVFDLYSGQWKKDMMDRVSRYPMFCFRLDLTVPYNSSLNQYC